MWCSISRFQITIEAGHPSLQGNGIFVEGSEIGVTAFFTDDRLIESGSLSHPAVLALIVPQAD